MANPTPIVMQWADSGDPRAAFSPFIDPATGDGATDGATFNSILAALPVGQKYLLFREQGPMVESQAEDIWGMSYRDWVEGALDPTHAMNVDMVAYVDAFFGAITEQVDYIFLDFERGMSYFAYFKGLGANGTHTISSITWSAGIATVTTDTDHGAVGDTGVNDADFITINAAVSDGSGDYNGYQHVLTSPTSTTLTFAAPVDGGIYTGDSGTLYGGVDGRDRHMQDVFDNANSIANFPATLEAPAIDGSDFLSNPDVSDDTDIVTLWGYWVTRQRNRQLRQLILDRAETQLGYRPRASNYNDIWQKWIVSDQSGGLNFGRGMTSVSSPSLYFASVTGSVLTGTDRQKMFQSFLIRMNYAESVLSSGNGELIPWVTTTAGVAPGSENVASQLAARMVLHLYELMCQSSWTPKFLWFNSSPGSNPDGTALMLETFFETIPATRFDAKALNPVSISDTSYTSGNVTTTLAWLESI